MLKIYVIIVFTLTITSTTNAAKEEDTENGAQNAYHVFDGTPHTYHFGYDSKAKDAPRLMREETRLSDGTVTGRYGYTDPFGVFRVVKYVSGNNGYYATEEIGEQVTSSTPQYYKATAPQVESVSEEPINYSLDLATKFNPPLYHPEAHTMSPNERPPEEHTEVESNRQPYGSVENSNTNHQIFSLSNSEDILENKYRQRKQFERNSRGYQSRNPINVLLKQSVSKRVGLLTPRYEAPPYKVPVIENNDNNRKINYLNNENHENIKPLIHQNINNNNDFLRRAPLQHQRRNHSDRSPVNNFEAKEQNTNYLKESDNKNNTYEDLTETTETPVTESLILSTFSPTEKVEKSISIAQDNLPDDISHLYYQPTRSPVISYSTSVPERCEIENQSDNKTETFAEDGVKTDVWTRLRHLFENESPTTTESVPTNVTEIPNITNSNEEVLPPNEAKTVFFSPVVIEDDHEIFRTIPGEIEPSSEYSNRNYFIKDEPIVSSQNEEHFSERITVSTPNPNISSSEATTENTLNYEIPVENSENPMAESSNDKDQQLESTTHLSLIQFEQGPTEFFTDLPRLSAIFEEQQNQTSDITKSAFFHDFLLKPTHDENIENTSNPLFSTHSSSGNQIFLTTTDNSLQTTEQNETLIQNTDGTTESTSHPTNEKFLEHFWNNFDEQSVLFSEAQVHNKTNAQNDSKPLTDETVDWISEQIDPKSIMFSEAKVDNKTAEFSIEPISTTEPPVFGSKITEISTQTTPIITETTTEVTTTTSSTTTPDITTTELINKEFLDNFWHNFNDNSDEYFENVFENKTNNQSEQSTAYPQINETTTEGLINTTSNKNVTEMENSLAVTESLDLDQMEDNNHSSNTTPPTFDGKFLPSVQLSDQNQYIPPLSALFEFPHMRKRVRRVQRLRNQQNITPEEKPTITLLPEEVDIISTDATEELSEIRLSEDSSHLKTTVFRVFQYVPPYPMLRESYIEDEAKPQELVIEKPIQYSQAFDDMSEIVTTIESMRKPIRPQIKDRPQTTGASKIVEFDDKPDSFVQVMPKTTRSKAKTLSQTRYLLPLEPQTESSFIRQLPEVLEINRNINHFRDVHRYEPIIRLEV